MKNSILRRTAFAVIILSITCALLSLTACGTALGSVKSMLKRKYNIKLPSDTEMVYCLYESKDSWFGDGVDYFVFKFKKEPTGVIENFTSLNLKEDENPNELKVELIAFFDSAISMADDKIPQKYLPDWDEEMTWQYGGQVAGLSAVYYPERMEMIICKVTI